MSYEPSYFIKGEEKKLQREGPEIKNKVKDALTPDSKLRKKIHSVLDGAKERDIWV